MKTLYAIPRGQTAIVQRVGGDADVRRRLCELGFQKGATVRCVGKSPLGNMKAFFVGGTVIALRKTECETIQVLRGDRPC
ncbi:MAG: ferrous iron transport protein A [Clostridia bacterium]|nr:ferrous iron transport protein A [Clostridia bacterium]